jgi:hypothetical protein
MRIAFHFDAAAWSEPRVRWTIATIAPLLDAPWRAIPPGGAAGAAGADSARQDEAPVWVGAPASAPAGTAIRIAYDPWPIWQASSFEKVTCDGVEMAAPSTAFPAGAPGDFPKSWLHSLWHVLSREEERQDARRDQWQCYSGAFTRLGAIGLLGTPWVNLAADRLRARLDQWCESRHAALENLPRWKNGAKFAVALSHDVDDVRLRSLPQAMRLLKLARSPGSYAFRGGLTALAQALAPAGGADPYSQFERWAGEESRRGFGATWFVFGRDGAAHEYDATYLLSDDVVFEGRSTPVGEMFGTLGTRGFEIGLHGTYGSWLDARILRDERERLAVATGRGVTSTRQHYLRFDATRTFAAQETAGFATDATLGYNEAIGFRAGVAAPFHPWNVESRGGHALLEVPLTLMDGALFRSLKLGPDEAAAATIAHLEAVERVRGLGGLLWHPNAAAEKLYPGWWRCFLAALDHLAARGAWVASVGEIADWWRERTKLHGTMPDVD